MSTTITRLYRTAKIATDAVNELMKKVGFTAADINLVTPPDGAVEISAIVDAIVKGGVPLSHARLYAPQVARGASLVTVVAPVFTSIPAAQIMGRYEPLDAGIEEPDVYTPAEFSGFPRIIRGETNTRLMASNSYFSSLFGLPLITRSSEKTSGLLTESKPFSGLLQGTVSSWLGLPTVSRDR